MSIRGAPALATASLLCALIATGSAAGQETAVYEVYAIEYASMPTVRLADWLPGADSTLTTPGSYMVWLLKGPDGRNVLVDTGFRWDVPSRATFPLPVQDYVRPDSAVAKAGVPPGEITDVILTHVHWDHADGTPLFPNAQVWIQRAEFEYYSDAVKNGGPGAREVEPRVMEELERLYADGRLTLVDGDDREIIDGIRVYTGARHTYESQYVGVNIEGGTVIVASDNAWFYANLELNLANGGTHDAAGQLAAQDRMRALAAHPTWILPGHDRRVFELFPKPGDGVARVR